MKNIFVLSALVLLLGSCSISNRLGKAADNSLLKQEGAQKAHLGIAVYDPAIDKYIFDYQSDKYFTPASNTKLLTCYLAMKYLEDSLQGFQYQILNDTTVLIRGTGDPTLLHPDFKNQPGIDFLKQFREIRFVPTGFAEFMGNGWAWDDYPYTYSAPRSGMPLYGDYIGVELKSGGLKAQPPYFNSKIKIAGDISEGFSIRRPWDVNEFSVTKGRNNKSSIPFFPDDNTIMDLLADTLNARVVKDNRPFTGESYVYTQPLDTMLSIMMHRSDNFFAEQSLLMVGRKVVSEMNDRKTIRKILETDFAGMPDIPRWADGSGLSPYNRLTPKDFVFLLKKMKDEFGMDRLKVILPTGGTGTLSSLYKEETGKIFAKTGTLNGVVTLSGYLITEKDRLLIFSVLVNNHNTSAAEIRKGIEKFIKQVRKNY